MAKPKDNSHLYAKLFPEYAGYIVACFFFVVFLGRINGFIALWLRKRAACTRILSASDLAKERASAKP